MKNGKKIISTLISRFQLYPLIKHKCYQKFIHLLPPRFQQAIAFVYIENETLFVALSHPGYKMELNYNQDLFKSLLRTFTQNDPECKEYHAKRVIFFNSKYHQPKQTPTDTVPYYYELSTGEFQTDIQNSEIKEQFEQIKELIIQNSKRQNEQ